MLLGLGLVIFLYGRYALIITWGTYLKYSSVSSVSLGGSSALLAAGDAVDNAGIFQTLCYVTLNSQHKTSKKRPVALVPELNICKTF